MLGLAKRSSPIGHDLGAALIVVAGNACLKMRMDTGIAGMLG